MQSVTQFPVALVYVHRYAGCKWGAKVISRYPDKQLLCSEQAITVDVVSGFETREFLGETQRSCQRNHWAKELIDAHDNFAEKDHSPGAYL